MFDPQKMYIDEHIDLVNTLGDMLGQKRVQEGQIYRYDAQHNTNAPYH